MPEPHIVILGGGPAGVGGAFQLRRLGRARVTLVEQREVVGGNAGSFDFGPHRMDYGSHRLHPACDPDVLADIEDLLNGDLLARPRHGRIRLRGRWIHFPLKPVDLLLRGHPGFTAGAVRDMALKAFRSPSGGERDESFASVLRASLGPTICDEFYFPYARKIWGRPPEDLSAIQARRRVSAGSFGKLLRKVFARVPGLRRPMTGRFYYPRHGYGQISEAYAAAAAARGADLLLGWTVVGLEPRNGAGWCIGVERDGERRMLGADQVWSTIPISLLARLVSPPPPPEVRAAADRMRFRGMILVYLELAADRFTEYDAHYFPDAQTAITRLSEPKNYAARAEPAGRTAICAELPCAPADRHWSMTDAELAEVVTGDLQRVGLPVPAVTAVTVRRLSHAYPIYERGYEEAFGVLDRWAAGLPGVLTYGRQGLFAHDNTHHALFMAYCAAGCIRGDGTFDQERWGGFREIFESHVVED